MLESPDLHRLAMLFVPGESCMQHELWELVDCTTTELSLRFRRRRLFGWGLML